MLELLNRLDVWLAIFTLGALAYFELRLGRFVGPLARGALSLFQSGASEVRRRASERRLPTKARLRPHPTRGKLGRFTGSLPVETDRNDDESRFDPVSAVATPYSNAETIAFRFLARLVTAGHVTETQALETACEVKAGSSKAYQEARAKLKKALEEQNSQVVETA